MSTELVVIEKQNVLSVFTEQGQIDPILEKIAADARSIVADVSTAKGRKEIASIAYRVAQSKTYLDGLGKELVADMKELPKKVDASRKQVRDFLDALKDEVRKPLDDWEAEQAAIEAKRVADEKAEKFHAAAVEHEAWFDSVIDQDWELALLADQIFNRDAEDKRKANEQAQRERDAALVQEAAAKAKADAEAAAQADKDAAAQRERDALLAKERAEADLSRTAQALVDAEAKAAQDKIESDRRAEVAKQKADADKKLAEEESAQRERDKQAADAKRLADEQAARDADTAHRAKINRAAVAAMVKASVAEGSDLPGITEAQAKLILVAVLKKNVPNVSITY